MKVKYFLKAFCGAALLVAATSCNDWLKEEEPGKSTPEDYFALGKAAIRAVNAAYTPLAWEFNSTYFSEWFIGDIASDDALKGGQNLSDMADAYDIENFKTNANNSLLRDFYRAQFQGIQRCNLAMQEVEAIEPDADMTAERKTCLMGEAYYMRAYYYFRLVRIFGGVPYVDKVIDSSKDWKQPRATAEEIYNHIIDDLKLAEQMLWNKSKYADADLGRATKGAAQAMLLKTYLYMHDYNNAYEWGKKFFEEQKNEYSLCPNYSDNFTLAGENGPESVFEIQYMADPTSDYGEGFGFTRGSFTTILTRSRPSACLRQDKSRHQQRKYCPKHRGNGLRRPHEGLEQSCQKSSKTRCWHCREEQRHTSCLLKLFLTMQGHLHTVHWRYLRHKLP